MSHGPTTPLRDHLVRRVARRLPAAAAAGAVVIGVAACSGDSSSLLGSSDTTTRPAAVSTTAAATDGVAASTPSSAPTTAPTTAPTKPAAESSTTTGAPARTAVRSAGCGTTFATGPTDQTIVSGGRDRLFRLALPAGYTGEDPLPLILNWHGFSSNAGEQAAYSGVESRGTAAGYAVATPQGTGDPAFWNIINRARGLDDVAYALDIIDWAGASLCIDTGRVYSTGISNGAGMSAYLACEIPERFAAIAPVAGINLIAPCNGPPTSVVAFHSLDDPVVPYGGGEVMNRPNLPFAGVDDAMAGWAGRAGCDPAPVTEAVSAHVDRIAYEGCTPGTDVVLYAISGDGHTWPGTFYIPRLGPVTDEIDATEILLDFFDAH